MARIKLKYVNGFSNKDRKNGRARYYFRRRGCKAIPLPGLPGSEELWLPIRRRSPLFPTADRDWRVPDPAGHHQRAGVAYYKSETWNTDYGADTQRQPPANHRAIPRAAW